MTDAHQNLYGDTSVTAKPNISANELLAPYTSWRIGGPARFFAEATTPGQLIAALDWARQHDLPVALLGGGTNTLVRDQGYPGLVLRYRAQNIHIDRQDDQVRVWIAAGAPTAGTARKLARQGYAGLEWAEGVPGTIGGAIYGNAGCYGGDIASVLARAWLLVNGHVEEWPVQQFAYNYRTSVLKTTTEHPAHSTSQSAATRPIIIAAECILTYADPRTLADRLALISQTRRSKTPSGQSCGSVFKNPPGDSAGRLIEAAGLKGARIGNAQISEKHANYIINLGKASSDDVLQLIQLAQERVAKEFSIELELEVQVLPPRLEAT